jgi:class 3 adenylate cyclase
MILCFGLLISFATILSGQTDIDLLEKQLNDLHGIEKLTTIIEITDHYLSIEDDKKALKYAHQGELLAKNIIQNENDLIGPEDYYLKPLSLINLGKAYQLRGRYLESKKAFNEAMITSAELNRLDFSKEATQYLEEIDSISLFAPDSKKPFLGKTIRDIGNAINKTSNEFGVTASLKLAKVYSEKEEYEKSLGQYLIAKNLLLDMGKFEKINEVDIAIKEVEAKIEKLVLEGRETILTTPTLEDKGLDLVQSTEITPFQNPPVKTPPSSPVPSTQNQETQPTSTQSNPEQIRKAAQNAESRRNYTESIDYYKQYIQSQNALQESQTTQQLALLEQANEIENRDREILLLKKNDQLLESEIRQKKLANKNLAIGTGLLGTVLLSLYFLYFNKQRAHKNLSTAYTRLEKTQNQLQTAQSRIKSLLHQQVSGAVADELLSVSGDHPIARRFVCIMFLDIRDFTVFAEELNPEEIIEYQNKIFGFMIEAVNRHHGIVNQILGDGFMATFGAPISAENDCQDAYLAAREIIETVNAKSLSGEIPPTKVGIGLHAGYVVTGNVGTADRKQYSITGNPVIIASRLEQLNKTFGSSIVISKDVYDELPEEDRIPMEFNEVTVKGRTKPVEVASI